MKRKKITQDVLLEYVRQNLTYEQIAKKEDVSAVTIWKHLKKIDENLLSKAKQEGQELERLQKQERILEYIRQGLPHEQIAEKEGVTKVTVWNYLKEIDENLLKQAEEEEKQMEQIERQKRLLEYIRQKLTREQMAEKEGVSSVTVWSYFKQINEDLKNRAKQEDEKTWQETKKELEEKWEQIKQENNEKWELLIQKSKEKWQQLKQENDGNIKQQAKRQPQELEKQTEQVKETKNEEQANLLRKRRHKTITIKDAKSYKEELDEKYDKITLKDIELLIRLYIKIKQIEEAIKFLNKTIYNEDMAYLGVEKLMKMKEQLEKTKKKQQVRELIQKGKKNEDVAKVVGLSETEIIQIRNEMESKLGIEI